MDLELASSLKEEIERFDVSVYMYEHDRRTGEELRAKFRSEIRNSDVLLALLTEEGAFSPTLNQEIGIALAERITILPAADERVSTDQFPLLQGLEWIQFDPESPDKLTMGVADQVKRLRDKNKEKNAAFAAVLAGVAAWLGAQ